MWIFKKNEKSWTCPNSSLVAIARIQASDREDTFKDCIVNNEIAKVYLEKLGFEIEQINDPEPMTEVPKVPNWDNIAHRDLYDKLFYSNIGRELTEEENEFCKRMYHLEEYSCGLDGDR